MANEAPLSVEAQLAVINLKLDTLLTQRDDHETRIRNLEKFAWKQAGLVGLISSALGAGAIKVMGA
jgi:hypothetical protein